MRSHSSSPVAVRRRTTDLIRIVIVFSVLVASIMTVERIQYLQAVLDGFNCCSSDVPMLRMYTHTRASTVSQGHRLARSPFVNNASTTCLRHAAPMQRFNISHADNKSTEQSSDTVQSTSTGTCGKLRRNWSFNPVQSPMARMIEAQQSNCSIPVATFYMDNSFGFGSHLHVWSQAMCNAMEFSQRVQTVNPEWLWLDQSYCSHEQAERSPLLCYFPLSEDRCDIGRKSSVASSFRQLHAPQVATSNVTDPKNIRLRCSLIRDHGKLTEFRQASMEYLFQSLSPLVIQEAERQMGALFGPDATVPNDLITVHLRWGDKFWEMDLPHENEYVSAVSQLLVGRATNQSANVYLSTEDPRAVEAFTTAAPRGWNIYVDRTIAELDAHRPKRGNRASWTAKNTHGRAGLVALGSLLVALEANYFVLTTKSNWSRLLDQLRRTMIDPTCDNCTSMIDLRPGEW
ncbi:hypothetical protein MPSEU_000316700 [Mayamaea pseudoterrestris]|nr:hypothetical protein MPSEU_000316700 [Mayamaea pseudoterrestris]